jgi:hypothetical protein
MTVNLREALLNDSENSGLKILLETPQILGDLQIDSDLAKYERRAEVSQWGAMLPFSDSTNAKFMPRAASSWPAQRGHYLSIFVSNAAQRTVCCARFPAVSLRPLRLLTCSDRHSVVPSRRLCSLSSKSTRQNQVFCAQSAPSPY